MLITACLRSRDGRLLGKVTVPEDCKCVAWGGHRYMRGIWGGADADGDFVVFVQEELVVALYIRDLYPMKRIEHISL